MSNYDDLNVDDFLFGDSPVNNPTTDVFDTPTTNTDGIYRPKIADAKDKKVGYRATIRFLPNIFKDKNGNIKAGSSAIKKTVHYINLPGEPKLRGYYDCKVNFNDKCELCNEYRRLDNSKNQADNEKAKTINKSAKYFSYVLIIEDEQFPDLVGKVMIFSYGSQVRDKILAEKKGEISGIECDIFKTTTGKDFRLIIKSKGSGSDAEKITYELSTFLEVSPIKLYSEKKKAFIEIPVDDNGKIIDDKYKQRLKKFLLEKDVDLEKYEPKEWSDEIQSKVDNLLAYYRGEDYSFAENKAKNPDKKSDEVPNDVTDDDDFFDDDL